MENKIKTKISNVFKKIKKDFVNDYFKLTFFYLAVYCVISSVIVYGITYITTGELHYGNILSEFVVVTITFMMTIATMAKRLKEDIVSNYWKLRKFRQKRRL